MRMTSGPSLLLSSPSASASAQDRFRLAHQHAIELANDEMTDRNFSASDFPVDELFGLRSRRRRVLRRGQGPRAPDGLVAADIDHGAKSRSLVLVHRSRAAWRCQNSPC